MIDAARKAESLRLIRACRAEHQQAGHAERIARHVTPQALEGPLELRRAGRRIGTLFERVKHDAGGLVVSGHFDDVTAAHPAERDAIVEEQRAGILFVDPPSLQAGAREDQQL